MSINEVYAGDFYEQLQVGSRRSAQVIVSLIMPLVRPKSVVDVGCGTGEWLAVFKDHGVNDCLGIDQDALNSGLLKISPDQFLMRDLEQPIELDRTFDLVLSLEVAEHLSPEHATTFIHSLTQLGSIILFSAAIPYQGGTHHVNEQWQEYWVRQFQQQGYQAIDCVRKHIWNHDDVEPWYAQNMLLFVRQDRLDSDLALQQEYQYSSPSAFNVVHPKIYLQHLDKAAIETKRRTEIAQQVSSSETALRLNETRFGSLELEITTVQLFDQHGVLITELLSGEPLRVAIQYKTTQSIVAPFFGITLVRQDGLICYNTFVSANDINLPVVQGTGQIDVYLDRLDLNQGDYYVDVGVYEQTWAYTYDYHWRIYPLKIHAEGQEQGILSLPSRWSVAEPSSQNAVNNG